MSISLNTVAILGNSSITVLKTSPIKLGSFSAKLPTSAEIPSNNLGTVASMRGTSCSATVSTLSTRLLIRASKFDEGSAIPVRKFSHAAFIMPMLP